MNFDHHSIAYSEQITEALALVGLEHGFFFEAKVREILAARRGLPAGSVRVLEIGCGVGLLQQRLRPLLGRVWGIDSSVGSLALAGASQGTLAAADGMRAPFADESFDLVIAVCVLHHVPVEQRDAFLAESMRVTRRGGVLALCEHNPWNPLTRAVVGRCEFDHDAVLLPRAELRRRLRGVGLGGIQTHFILFFPWRGSFWRRLERLLAWIPFGGQYFIRATRV